MSNVISTKAVLDQSQISIWQQGVILAAQEVQTMDAFVSQYATAVGGTYKAIKFGALTSSFASLTDGTDVEAEGIADSVITFTPTEYGHAVQISALGEISTGNRAMAAAIQNIGYHMGTTQDRVCLSKLAATTNILAVAATGSMSGSNVLAATHIETLYNKLRRNSIQKFTGGGDPYYVLVAHPDVISDLRTASSTGDWIDVNKYATPGNMLRNEMGFYKGFRIIETPLLEPTADISSTVDGYKTLALGYNSFGKAVAKEPTLVINPGFDKLNRLMTVGWYGVFDYQIVDTSACWAYWSAASRGANT